MPLDPDKGIKGATLTLNVRVFRRRKIKNCPSPLKWRAHFMFFDIDGLMNELEIKHDPEEWHMFIEIQLKSSNLIQSLGQQSF